MKINILMISLFLFIGCNQKAQKYNYEIEDSDDSYVMDGWSTEQKEDYYQKAGNLLRKFLLHDNYKIPTEVEFSKILREKLNISINTDKVYQIVPHHIFQTDSLDNTYSQLIIFPQEKIISFKSELPLLDKESIENYNSSDFKNLDHSKDYNNVINKLLFNPNQKEIDIWLKDEQLKDIFIFLVADFHFYYEDRIFKYIIEELKRSPEKYKAEYIKLLFQRNKKAVDKDFLSRIAYYDRDKTLLPFFLDALSIININDKTRISEEIKTIYNSTRSISNKLNSTDVQDNLKKGFHIIDEINADLDGDSYPDKIYIASSQQEMMELQILIFKNNKGSFSLWAKNDSSPILGEKEYKKTVTKGNYFTLEYTRDLEDKYNIYNYLTFKLRDNNFILHKFSQETYDAKANKKLPIKAWNENNFGIINFNTTTYEFLDHLK